MARKQARKPPPYEDYGREGQERWHEITIIAQDPSVKDPDPPARSRQILTTVVRVPFDQLEPGPRSHRFHVVDFNSTTRTASKPAVLHEQGNGWAFCDRFQRPAKQKPPTDPSCYDPALSTDASLLSDRRFYAQNVYAVAARTLAFFEAALGRRLAWGFESHQLYLVPDAMEQANAYYSAGNRGIVFGYFGEGKDLCHTCLSYDIIAHETTHAILDGMRPFLLEPGLPDQLAFHEGLADIVALLSVFSMSDVVIKLLKTSLPKAKQRPKFTGKKAEDKKSLAQYLSGSAVFELGEEFGRRLDPHATSLRNSVRRTPDSIPNNWRDDPKWMEPHLRAEILVAAVLQSFVEIWIERILVLAPDDPTIELIGQEGATAATHLLTMVIRALDYLPPVEPTFEDVVDAILTADESLVPMDDHGYRKSIYKAFAEFTIVRPELEESDLTCDPPKLSLLNFEEFSNDPDEVWKFLWQNGCKLSLDVQSFYTRVCDVQPSIRVGPDGFSYRETVVCFIQTLEGQLSELIAFAAKYKPPTKQSTSRSAGHLAVPPGMTRNTQVRLWGGGVLIFDQFGRPKQELYKNIWDWKRQSLRLRRLGASPSGEFAARVGFDVRRMSSSAIFHSTPAVTGTE